MQRPHCRWLLSVLFVCACSENSDSDGTGPTPGPEGADGGNTATQDGGGTTALDAGLGRLVSIAIRPADAELVSSNGARVEQRYEVYGTYQDGTELRLERATYSVEPVTVGQIVPTSGRFVANGVIGGTATVRAMAAGLEASTTVTVRLEHTILGPNVPTDAPDRFTAAPVSDPARAPNLVYPLEGAVMPQNVFPAEVQWLEGARDDIIRVRISKPNLTVTAYVLDTGRNFSRSWLVDLGPWRSIAQTNPDQPASFHLTRFHSASGEVVEGARTVAVRFANTAITGSVYYWDIAAGRIQRIDDGTNQAVSFMPSPPAVADGSRCVGCHTVSTSGRWMAGRLGGGDNIGAIFDLTTDLSGAEPPTTYPLDTGNPSSIRWWFSSWNPDDTRIVASTSEGGPNSTLVFYDPFTGVQVPSQGNLPTNATHPAWSPDGTAIAYVTNVDAWGGDFSAGDIGVIDVTGPDAVANPRILHMGASLPAGTADSYPTWSPDNMKIAFANGNGCRSENDLAALYAMNRDGSQVVRLSNASGGPTTTNTFQPRFSPFSGGGYHWLSYLTRRDYGNDRAGTRGSGLQQIWVSAVRMGAGANEDPSEVGYWLPGQATDSRNISAYWAPRPCRGAGEACSVGSECCSEDCRPNENNELVCSPPAPMGCGMQGAPCTLDGDCCLGLSCQDEICDIPPV